MRREDFASKSSSWDPPVWWGIGRVGGRVRRQVQRTCPGRDSERWSRGRAALEGESLGPASCRSSILVDSENRRCDRWREVPTGQKARNPPDLNACWLHFLHRPSKPKRRYTTCCTRTSGKICTVVRRPGRRPLARAVEREVLPITKAQGDLVRAQEKSACCAAVQSPEPSACWISIRPSRYIPRSRVNSLAFD